MNTFRSTIVFALLVAAVGCSTSSTAPPPSAPPQHLYVTDRLSPSTVYVFNLPLTATSTPVVTLLTTGNIAGNPCFDNAGHIMVPMSADHKLQVFALPLTAASTPAFTLNLASTGEDCHFDASGNLYVAENAANQIEVFKAPVIASSTANSTLIGAQVTVPWGVWVDSSGNVFGSTGVKAAFEFSAFPANTPTADFGPPGNDVFGIAVGPSGSLYVANATSGGVIDVYDPPFTNASVKNPAKTITTSLTGFVSYMAFDSAGNLYAGGDGATAFHVLVYAPPYSGTPLDLNRGSTEVEGTAIGP
jgi:hypothetical protein